MNGLEKGGPIDANNIYHIDTNPIETITGNYSIILVSLLRCCMI